ncbi:MAG TPA: pyridoxamine 5'-phosphate oxidase family protein [Candidatus Saccharimonadales bacterium]
MATHKEVLAFLEKHKLGILSTASASGEVWGTAVYFIINEKFDCYFFAHTQDRKYRNITQHPQVALTVVDDAAQTTVQMSGKAVEVTESDELDMAYSELAQVRPPGQLSWVPPVSKIHGKGEIEILRLTPDALQFSVFKPAAKPSSSHVTQII